MAPTKTFPAADVTFAVTHFERPDDLARVVDAINRNFPGSPLVIVETGGNVSRGRNVAAGRVKTPFLFALDDDMIVDALLNVDALRRILNARPDVVGVSGAMLERQKGIRSLAANYRPTRRALVVEDAPADIQTTPAGDRFVLCDLTFTFGLYRTADWAKYKWNESLEMAEHYEHFWQLVRRGVHRMAFARSLLVHRKSRPSKEYRDARFGRYSHFAKLEQQSIGLPLDLRASTGRKFFDLVR